MTFIENLVVHIVYKPNFIIIMRNVFFVLIVLFNLSKIQAQSFSPDTLYLRLDTMQVRELATDWYLGGNKERKFFDYKYFPLRGGSPLAFVCEDRATAITKLQSNLGNYPIRTLEQLENYFNTLTQQQILKYLEKIKRYYIVQVYPNGTAEIIPVKLDMQID